MTNSPKLINKFKNIVKERKEEEGKASAIIEVLSELGEVPNKLRDKVYAQKDMETLKQLLELAIKAESISDFEY